ncbi:hypothetical protein DBV15_11262 [Temnothorax longispinosus]|uniref:Uncharacterized protein n=1 Tax=Temnothorax longispinosus TaxID=300112 RepID=A0A4S2KQD8_9HYME|nr:hypothetical protein DBV15_11262 [Temnothorax longispinosus]
MMIMNNIIRNRSFIMNKKGKVIFCLTEIVPISSSSSSSSSSCSSDSSDDNKQSDILSDDSWNMATLMHTTR